MASTILAPLDGSALAQRALPFAARLARATNTTLLLVRAPVDIDEHLLSHAELVLSAKAHDLTDRLASMAELAELATRLRQDGLTVSTSVRPGDPAAVIIGAARAHDVGLIVMSTHGRGGLERILYGSVADQIIRWGGVPILLVPARCESTWPSDRRLRILVPLDESRFAEAIIETAASLAGALGADLLLLHVLDAPTEAAANRSSAAPKKARRTAAPDPEGYLESLAERLRPADQATAPRCLSVPRSAAESVASTIDRVVQDESVDLIAMTTHGRGGLTRLVLGSVATETLQVARAPVLLLRPDGVRPSTPAIGRDRSSSDAEPA